MDNNDDVAGTRLLCIGDHDLAPLAACLANPEVRVRVVDLDGGWKDCATATTAGC